ncbi:MAG: HAD-IB family phosphatase [Desulfatiglandales bacterium]
MPEPAHIVSLSAIGPDSPGLVSRITNRVLQLKGNILDVKETCRRGIFSIFLVIDFTASDQAPEAIQESLNGMEEETGLKVILRPSDDNDIPAAESGDHLLITILGMDRPGIIAEISSLLHAYNANIEDCRMIARGPFFSMEMVAAVRDIHAEGVASHAGALKRMKQELKEVCARLDQSVVIQSESTYRQAKRIVVFDVEACLIEEPSAHRFLDALNERLGPSGRSIGPLSPEGTGAWAQALVDHVDAFQGVPMQELEAAGRNLKLHAGALELLRILKAMGYKVALLSTGFDCFLKWIYEAEGVDYAFCNTLRRDEEGNAAGILEEPVLTAATKNEILEFIMSMEGISRDQVVAVGDGSARSRFMKDVGLSIAYRPGAGKLSTDGVFSSDHMLNILYCLGITEEDIAGYRETSEA